MSCRWGSLALALVALIWIGVAGAVPAEADQIVGSVPPLFYPDATLSAYAGLVVLGGHDANGRGSFFAVGGGGVTRLPIDAPRGGGSLGHLDIGPGPRGGSQAAYELCHSTTSGDAPSGCDVYRYDVRSRRTRPVSGASSRRYEEQSASVWRGRVAFVRARVNGDDEFVTSGPRLGVFATPPLTGLAHLATPAHRGRRVGITQADVRGQTLAYVTFDYHRHSVTTLLVKRLRRGVRGHACEIARGGAVAINAPQIDGDYVYWRLDGASRGLPAWTIHRRRLPGPHCHSRGREQVVPRTFKPSFEPSSSVVPLSFAVDRGHVLYSVDVTEHPESGGVRLSIDHGEVRELQPVTFHDL